MFLHSIALHTKGFVENNQINNYKKNIIKSQVIGKRKRERKKKQFQ